MFLSLSAAIPFPRRKDGSPESKTNAWGNKPTQFEALHYFSGQNHATRDAFHHKTIQNHQFTNSTCTRTPYGASRRSNSLRMVPDACWKNNSLLLDFGKDNNNLQKESNTMQRKINTSSMNRQTSTTIKALDKRMLVQQDQTMLATLNHCQLGAKIQLILEPIMNHEL